MRTRSSRYLDEDISTKPKSSRADKNKYLYDEVNAGIRYNEIDNFSYGGKIDNNLSIRTREDYQKMTEVKPLEEDNVKEEKKEEKVYDINSVLEEARKNRTIPEEVEKKRNLQNAEYSILADLNKKYVSKKEKEDLEKEGIRELIDTITSKNLPKEIAKAKETEEDEEGDLLSDLMATNTMNAIGNINDINLEEEIAKEILVEKEEKDDEDEIKKEDGRLVNSFYTRSMDLTEHDFDIKGEFVEEHKNRTKILILVVLIIIVLLGIAALFVLRHMEIINF